MELTGNLKKQVESAATKEEKKEILKNAGMQLNDGELDMVSGGTDEYSAEGRMRVQIRSMDQDNRNTQNEHNTNLLGGR